MLALITLGRGDYLLLTIPMFVDLEGACGLCTAGEQMGAPVAGLQRASKPGYSVVPDVATQHTHADDDHVSGNRVFPSTAVS